MSDTCNNCRFWRKGSVGQECQRFPPTVLELGNNLFTAFPRTAMYEWCGEHQKVKPA